MMIIGAVQENFPFVWDFVLVSAFLRMNSFEFNGVFIF